MIDDNNHGPSLGTLFRKTIATGLGALQNRGELLLLEAQEEKLRLIKAAACAVGALVLGIITVLMVTALVLFLVPESYRPYVAGGFAFLYLLGTIALALGLRSLLKKTPFRESLGQLRKDRELLETMR